MAEYDQGIGQLEHGLGRIDNQLGVRLGNINNQYTTKKNELKSSWNRAEGQFNDQTRQNQQQRRTNINTETIKQQGVAGSKKICKPSKPGYEDKVEVITQPVNHVIVRTPKPAPQPIQQQRYRVGAICRDGWQSHATGRGACSHHGGVSEWLYE